MPELPEVETVMRGLSPVLTGQTIQTAKHYRPDLRIPFPDRLQQSLKNQTILHLERRAKYILVHLQDDHILGIHLGMSGSITFHKSKDKKFQRGKHDHFILNLGDGTLVIYNDPSRFGMIFLTRQDDLFHHPLFQHLGVEPLSKKFDGKYLLKIFERKTQSIKQAIMDQRVVVGVGNIYAAEALYLAKIHPMRQAKTLSLEECVALSLAIKSVLKRAIKAGGSSLKDYKQTDGTLGYFQHQFSVYDREGLPCPDCTCKVTQRGGIQRIVQGGRSSFFCPSWQK